MRYEHEVFLIPSVPGSVDHGKTLERISEDGWEIISVHLGHVWANGVYTMFYVKRPKAIRLDRDCPPDTLYYMKCSCGRGC
jgi:hypothetical protein